MGNSPNNNELVIIDKAKTAITAYEKIRWRPACTMCGRG